MNAAFASSTTVLRPALHVVIGTGTRRDRESEAVCVIGRLTLLSEIQICVLKISEGTDVIIKRSWPIPLTY
jgi:hypothetical protein